MLGELLGKEIDLVFLSNNISVSRGINDLTSQDGAEFLQTIKLNYFAI